MYRKYALLISITALLVSYFYAEEMATYHTFYKEYKTEVPANNYVVLFARRMLPNKYLILNLKTGVVRIFSPYSKEGLLQKFKLNQKEFENTKTLFEPKLLNEIPKSSNQSALDAFEFSLKGVVEGNPVSFHHILPNNTSVLSIHKFYESLLEKQ